MVCLPISSLSSSEKRPFPCPCKPPQLNSVGYKTKNEDITVGGEFVRKDRRFSRRKGGGEKVIGGGVNVIKVHSMHMWNCIRRELKGFCKQDNLKMYMRCQVN